MRQIESRRVAFCGVVTTLLAVAALAASVRAPVSLGFQVVTERSKNSTRSTRQETLAGAFVRADRRQVTQITYPEPPVRPGPAAGTRSGFAHNGPVSAQKDYVLLVLHFELRPSACAQLDRERLVVSEAEGKEYRYGGWRVEDAQYELCREPAASLIHGPWDNEFWDPLAIRPKLGSLDLVFPVSAKATKLTFTDGVVEIDLHTPRKP